MFAVILTRLNIVITKIDTILNELIGLINSLNSPASTSATLAKAKMFKIAKNDVKTVVKSTVCCGSPLTK